MTLLTTLLRIAATIIGYVAYVLLVRYLVLGYSLTADIYTVEHTIWRWFYRHEQPLDVTLRRLTALRMAVEQGAFNDDTGIVDGEYRDASNDRTEQARTDSDSG